MILRHIAGKPRRVDGWHPRKDIKPLWYVETFRNDHPSAGGVPDNLIPSVQDQGQVGDCVAQTVREVLTGLDLKHGKGQTFYSALYTYWWARNAEGTLPDNDAGASVYDGFQVAATRGVPLNQFWDDSKPFQTEPTAEADLEAAKHKAIMVFSLPNILTIKTSLASGFGVGFGFDVPSQMMSDACAKSGMVEYGGSWDGGGHAVSCWRWDDTIKIGNDIGAFYCLNHWSRQWGLDGKFWLPYSFFQNGHASDCHTVRLLST